jgi:hypothetical protein
MKNKNKSKIENKNKNGPMLVSLLRTHLGVGDSRCKNSILILPFAKFPLKFIRH